jgi:hypothetical protein
MNTKDNVNRQGKNWQRRRLSALAPGLDHGPAQSRQRCGTKISGHGESLFQKQRIAWLW